MKRSAINAIISNAINFFEHMHFKLPPWAFWAPADWHAHRGEATGIIAAMLGWDITDFGGGDFRRKGLLIFTLRNGNSKDPLNTKTYCEKALIMEDDQELPLHFHWRKNEDIINRGGGIVHIQLYGSTPEAGLADAPITVMVDAIPRRVDPGGVVSLMPGESIYLERGMYHRFSGEKGAGKILLGEVSAVNDDATDNRFYADSGRFPVIEEDVEPEHYLVSDYQSFLMEAHHA